MSSDSSSSSSSVASDDVSLEFTEDNFLNDLQRMWENDPTVTRLVADGSFACIQDMTDNGWEKFGRDVSNSNHLDDLQFSNCLDDHNMSFLFRGLTRSSSIRRLGLFYNGLGFNGVQSMVPFLQNANTFLTLNIDYNNITTEGFSLMFRALRDSPIRLISVNHCGLDSIAIDDAYVPNNLRTLLLNGNKINADGCRQIAKLLQRENATLEQLRLGHNKIDDEGIEILANALRSNTSLILLNLDNNLGVTIEGMKSVLKLINDISSIKATLQSNHTLYSMTFNDSFEEADIGFKLRRVLEINWFFYKIEGSTGPDREKVILTQLDSKLRAEMCRLQGLEHSCKPLTEIGPLLLPEVLEIAGRYHGLSEFYESFRACFADLWATNNRETVLQQKKEEIAKELDALAAKKLELENQMADVNIHMEIAAIRQHNEVVADDGLHSSKRQRMS